MSNLFIEKKDLDILMNIFSDFCPSSEVFAYGSRVNGKAHDGSDLDLAIKNFPKEKFLFELKEKISNSNISFLVDINLYENLPTSFQQEIDKNSIKIYPQISL